MIHCIGIDIGSTWTKGALFELDKVDLRLKKRASLPTTVQDLAEGFGKVLSELASHVYGDEWPSHLSTGELELSYSSSAKGGLAVAALGLVPEITLETAKLAAYSAGAKLSQVLSYRLNASDIRSLEQEPPDILLFAGGTDGGNSEYVIANAKALSVSKLNCSMVYAGNRSARDDVSSLLAGKDFCAVDNLLPTLDSPNPEPVRDALRSIFLRRIVKGKGLDRVIEIAGSEPLPTPYAMYEFVGAIREHVPGWKDFILVDIGGATTDVYSSHRESPQSGTVVRGLPEPDVKRTVEGDLGLRVSARSTLASLRIERSTLNLAVEETDQLKQYVDSVSGEPMLLPSAEMQKRFDALLAGHCFSEACQRHAGRSQEICTPDGLVQLQLGRDLRRVSKVVGSGGWLAHATAFDPSPWFRSCSIDSRGRLVLLPTAVNYLRDAEYLLPLYANVARKHPVAAAFAAVRALIPH